MSDPTNGEVEIIASVAAFSCDNGHEIVGEDVLNCLTNGIWSSPVPTCARKMDYSIIEISIIYLFHALIIDIYYDAAVDCGVLSISFGTVTTTPDTTFQSVAEYRCQLGYILEGFSNRVCEADGEWSEDDPECVRKFIFNSTVIIFIMYERKISL